MVKIDSNPVHEFKYVQNSNHGFTFFLLTDDFRALHTPTMCKDYFQDIFWCEYLGKSGGAYGLYWEAGKLDINQPRFKLALSWGESILADRVEPLQKFLNLFEEKQGIDPSIVMETNDPHTIVIDFSKEWTTSGPLVSCFTYLIRLSGQFVDGDPLEYLEGLKRIYNIPDKPGAYSIYVNITPSYMTPDLLRFPRIIDKLKAIYRGDKIPDSWDKSPNITHAHNYGLMYCEGFPVEKKGE